MLETKKTIIVIGIDISFRPQKKWIHSLTSAIIWINHVVSGAYFSAKSTICPAICLLITSSSPHDADRRNDIIRSTTTCIRSRNNRTITYLVFGTLTNVYFVNGYAFIWLWFAMIVLFVTNGHLHIVILMALSRSVICALSLSRYNKAHLHIVTFCHCHQQLQGF